MDKVTLRVSGLPKGQPRPRAFARNGMVRMYDPGTAEGWKQAVAVAARNAGVKTDAPVSVEMVFHMQRPTSHMGKGGIYVKPSAPVFHAQKPDVDNLAKAVLDALTTIGAWKDDAQVCRLLVSRQWNFGGIGECVILIEEL